MEETKKSDDVNPWFHVSPGYHAVGYAPGARPSLEIDHSIAFLLNVSRLVGQPTDGSFSVAPGHELRRANAREIVAIKDVVKGFFGEHDDVTNWEFEKVDGRGFNKLPENEWRYFVISFSGTNKTVSEIEQALSIAHCEMRIGFALVKVPHTLAAPFIVFEPGRLFQLLQRNRDRSLPMVDISESDLNEIKGIHEQLLTFKHDGISVGPLIEQLLDLEALPPDSPLIFLGYFAVLESVLTHQPKKTDTIDSITRQIIKKVALLDNRWKPRISYENFEGAKPETIWSAMYSYRSCLAHGSKPDFGKDLHVLKNGRNVLRLLRNTVKGIARQTLVEPQLIVDLRNC